MSLAMRLPKLSLSGLPLPRVAVGQLWRKHHWPVTGLAALLCAGAAGFVVWQQMHATPASPEAVLAVGPMPAPLVPGMNPKDMPLPAAPLAGLEAMETDGKLPRLGPGGLAPYKAYGYPFDSSDARPRITIILTGAGPQPALLESAIKRLPGSVTLSFSTATPDLGLIMARTRQAGHEMMLQVPADGLDPSSYDPGPGALRNNLSINDNIQRLRLLMARTTGYVGLLLDPQTAILARHDLGAALLQEGRSRGLALVSGSQEFGSLGENDGAPVGTITTALDATLDPATLDATLAELEQRARESGHVIATSALYPYIIDRLADWLPTLSAKGLAIAPVSAVVSPLVAPEQASTPRDAAPDGHGGEAAPAEGGHAPAPEHAPAHH